MQPASLADRAAAAPPSRGAWWSQLTALAGARVVLAPVAASDADELAEILWTSRAHLAPWISVPSERPSHAAMVARCTELAAAFVAREHALFTIRRRSDRALLGCLGLTPSAAGAWSLSYWLAREHTGHGHAREAAALLLAAVFARAPGDRVELACRRDNPRSAQLARCLGFVRCAGGDDPDVLRWQLTAARDAAWRALFATAAALGEVSIDDDGGILVVDLHVALGVRVFAELGFLEPASGARSYVVVDLAHRATIGASELLARNAELVEGALYPDGDRICLRHTCPPGPPGLTAASIRALIAEVADLIQVDAAVPHLLDTDADAAFGHYAG